jgi:peptidoglycan/LPS O-acetylase OafA/YrhL
MCFAASFSIFMFGYPFGIFRASRLLGMSLREIALNCLFAGCIAFALLAGTSRWKAVVNQPVLQFFGEISYGVYLLHMLVFDVEGQLLSRFFPNLTVRSGNFALMVLFFVFALVVTVAIASLCRWYFEEPFLRLKQHFGRPKTQAAQPELTYSKTA